MNPLKRAFGVSPGKLLGFTVHHKGIELDPVKAKAIEGMESPQVDKIAQTLPREGLLHQKVHSCLS